MTTPDGAAIIGSPQPLTDIVFSLEAVPMIELATTAAAWLFSTALVGFLGVSLWFWKSAPPR